MEREYINIHLKKNTEELGKKIVGGVGVSLRIKLLVIVMLENGKMDGFMD